LSGGALNGTTGVPNVPDHTGGLVKVEGKDSATSLVVLHAGQEPRIVPGQPPAPAAPQDTFSLSNRLAETRPSLSQAQQRQREPQQP
jgi:hypothetical protein